MVVLDAGLGTEPERRGSADETGGVVGAVAKAVSQLLVAGVRELDPRLSSGLTGVLI